MLRKNLLLITLSLVLFTELPLTMLVANASPVNEVSTEKAIAKTSAKRAKRRRGIRFKVPGIRASRNLEAGAARGVCSPQTISAVLSPKSKSEKPGQIPVEKTLSIAPHFL